MPVVPWEGAPAARGPPDQPPHFYHSVLTFERAVYAGLNLTTATKKRLSTFGRRKVQPERENPGYAYEKGLPPYVGMGPPEWLIRPCKYLLFDSIAVVEFWLKNNADGISGHQNIVCGPPQ